jgi:hypothetical protein
VSLRHDWRKPDKLLFMCMVRVQDAVKNCAPVAKQMRTFTMTLFRNTVSFKSGNCLVVK